MSLVIQLSEPSLHRRRGSLSEDLLSKDALYDAKHVRLLAAEG